MSTEDLRVEQRDVDPFDHLVMRDDSCAAELIIEQTEVEGLRIEGKPDMLRRIETHVRDGKLIIRTGGTWLERLGDKLSTSLTRSKTVYHVHARELRSLDLGCAALVYATSLRTDDLRIKVSGAVRVVVEDLMARELRVEHSGAGEIELAGQATRPEVLLNGTGRYLAPGLQTQVSVIWVSGAAHARVRASAELEVVVRGMSAVEYFGTPRVRQRVLGMGRVVRVG